MPDVYGRTGNQSGGNRKYVKYVGRHGLTKLICHIEVMRQLVLDIGITEEQYEVWVEMEMAELFVSLRCRK